ncbi:CHAT domain-containing protein [Methanothrix soehngenii]|uniref:CHAT domain-containing protein n=1 Tax=Methanothrix soehngenii TaxID=2223 RepID=UPI002BC9B74C|nr:CHAT domain-containing protein [Methanothrix soehngenii]HOS22818.1 CHAT domain-containing protein [Methanothrix soehngenii]HPL21580.1 CHAT domain-containing protein [Methanothrix soehngenii]
MFDNYDIQVALLRAQDAIKIFKKENSDSALNDSIQRLNELLVINEKRNHLQKYDINFRTICELGKLFQYRYDKYGAERDLSYGIYYYELAEKLVGELHPDRPSILNSLGNLLHEKILYEMNSIFLETAIEHFKKAEEFYQKTLAFESIDRKNRPIILNGLGRALHERYAAAGNIKDLYDAIETYEKALRLSSSDALIRLIILNNLALSIRDRFDHDEKIAYLDEAINIWYETLSLARDPKYMPILFSNLGEALRYRAIFYYSHLQKDHAIKDIEDAIRFSQKAVDSSLNKSIDKATYLGNLGNQLSEMHRFLRDSSKRDEANKALEKSISIFKEIVDIFPRESIARIGSLSNLGLALRDKYNLSGDVSFLLRSFYAYREANESMNRSAIIASITYKIGVRKRFGFIDDMLVETAIRLNKLAAQDTLIEGIKEVNWGREAMIYSEGAKSSILSGLLGRRDMPVLGCIPSDLIKREKKLLKELNTIDLLELSKLGELPIKNEKSNARSARLKKSADLSRELADLWRQIELFGPESREYVALRRGDKPSWEDLTSLIKNSSTALLSLFPLAQETVLFILRKDWSEPTMLEISIGSEAQLDIWRRFQREIHLYNSALNLKETWDRDLILLLKKASNYLDGIDQVIVSPGRFGCLLPWEALFQKAGVNVNLTTIPNLKIWSLIDNQPSDSGPALVIGNPNGGDDLIYAEEEARQIAELLGVTPLIGPQATKEIVFECLPEANVAHFATHAYFSLENPLDSGIILADGVLTIREILKLDIHLKLLVLSACESGMNSSLGGDEMVGLAQGFMLAGAKSMLVSLWKVNDLSTASLMKSYYTRWINEEANNAEALRYAMEEIRNIDENKWNYTYYWGAFTLVGDVIKYK